MTIDLTSDSFTLTRAILNTLAYADVFDYPLSAGEVQHYLSGLRAPLDAVSAELERMSEAGMIGRVGLYYLLPGREAGVPRRAARERQAELLWPAAVRYGRVIARLPFVRMLAVTGSLSVNNIDPGGDIDYLIVTAPGHLWLCRLLVLVVVRLASWRGLSLCPNYLLSENALAIPEHNLYAAHEFAQMVPLCGLEVYRRMRALNPWVWDFLPNADGFEQGREDGSGVGLPFLESILSTAPGVWLGNWEMTRKIRKLSRENAGNPEAVFNADLCKGHSNRHGLRTAEALAERLNRLALETRE